MPHNQTVGPPWFREICAGYLRWLTRKGRRPNSIRIYNSELRAFGRWLDLETIPEADRLTGRHVEDFQDWRAGQVKPRTLGTSLAAVRGALKWAATQEPALVAPTLWLRLVTPRTHPLMPRPIPQSDLDRLLAALAPRPARSDAVAIPGPHGPELDHLLRLRTRALFLLILSSGARISEALSLDRDSLQGRTAVVVQKGNREKMLLISETAAEAVNDYLAARSDRCPALFIGHAPQQRSAPNRMARSSEQLRWDALCEQSGVARYTTHQIRHTTATELLRQGVDSLVVARHLGHSDLSTIATYAQVGMSLREHALEVFDARIRQRAS